MKPARLRPRAREDRRDTVRYYRREAGIEVASRLVLALRSALHLLEQNPAIGSPILGQQIGVESMRTWRIEGFPLTFWYFDRESFVEVARLVGHRQDALQIDPDET